jgi:transposase
MRKMAPKLVQSQYLLISDMLRSKSFKAHEIARAVEYSVRSIYVIKSNIRLYSSTKAPSNSSGRPRNVTPVIGDTLCEYLLEKPDTYQDKMVLFLLDEFRGRPVSTQSIKRWLKSIGWTKKRYAV